MSIIEKCDSLINALTGYSSISLEELNAKASMLARIDNKYVIHKSILENVITESKTQFSLLSIGGYCRFPYETIYLDDSEKHCYYQHHNGHRRRIKIRLRRYIQTGETFLEAKIKTVRGITVKERKLVVSENNLEVTRLAQEFLKKLYKDYYQEDINYSLEKTLLIEYTRSTLVAKAAEERVTLDNAIQFCGERGVFKVNPDLYIVETKSKNANGIFDAILRQYHQHPLNRSSKYCLGLGLTKSVSKINNFKSTMRFLTGDYVPRLRNSSENS